MIFHGEFVLADIAKLPMLSQNSRRFQVAQCSVCLNVKGILASQLWPGQNGLAVILSVFRSVLVAARLFKPLC